MASPSIAFPSIVRAVSRTALEPVCALPVTRSQCIVGMMPYFHPYPSASAHLVCIRSCLSHVRVCDIVSHQRHSTNKRIFDDTQHTTRKFRCFSPPKGGGKRSCVVAPPSRGCVVAPPSRGLLGGEEGKGGVADRPRPSELVMNEWGTVLYFE